MHESAIYDDFMINDVRMQILILTSWLEHWKHLLPATGIGVKVYLHTGHLIGSNG